MNNKTNAKQTTRMIDLKKDLGQVADLIELCFHHYMDPDGKRYLEQIRKAATNRLQQRVIKINGMQISYPIYGFVWEIDNQIVGNITIIPHLHHGKWFFLVANIAVHPDHRRKGIARELTQKAIDYLNENNVHVIWLQVREDNEYAINLYRSLGFKDKAIRTMWILKNIDNLDLRTEKEIIIDRRKKSNWKVINNLLYETYPKEINWYLPFDIRLFKPGIFMFLFKIFYGKISTHWEARLNNEFIGSASWQPTNMFADFIWLAVKEQYLNEAIEALLIKLDQYVVLKKPLLINYPFGKGTNAFINAGFRVHNSFIWMEYSRE